MLHHNKKNEKSQPNTFIDGVNVKISEQYKPPRRVILPVSCQNNNLGEALFVEYDFTLEQNILDKIAEWKSARKEEVEQRRERLKKETKVCQEHFNNIPMGSAINKEAEKVNHHLNSNLTDSVLTPICAKQNSPSHKTVSSSFNLSDFESDNSSPFDNMELKTINDMEVLASILSTNNMETPKHKFSNINNNHNNFHNNNNNNSNNSNHINNNNNNNNKINIIDKNLCKNYLELNIKNNEWGHAHLNGYSTVSYSNLDHNHLVVPLQHSDFNQFGFYSPSEHRQISNFELNEFSNQFGAAVALDQAAKMVIGQEKIISEKNKGANYLEGNENISKCIPDIMLELEKELKESQERDEEKKKRNKLAYIKESILNSSFKDEIEMPETSRRIESGRTLSKLSDPTPTLSLSSQKLVKYISDMGFPPARTARACQLFRNDDRKIIEFLIQVQKFEEKKYPGDLAEKALKVNNFQTAESIKYLEAMMVLLDLGFEEEKVEEALLEANIDRDKALDMLIS